MHLFVAPGGDEIRALVERHGVGPEIVEHALDPRERVRLHEVAGVSLMVLRVPCRTTGTSGPPYRTAPLVVVRTAREVVVISAAENDVVAALRVARDQPPSTSPIGVAVRALEATASTYLTYLEEIESATSGIEQRLALSLRNEEVLELLQYQKTLVHFTAALRASFALGERLLASGARRGDDDEERAVLQDAVVELRQALEVADLARETLGETMDTFASLISNNLNDVMRVLAAAAIVLTPPVVIASFWGMNVIIPLRDEPYGFAMLVAASLTVSAVVAGVLRLRRWM